MVLQLHINSETEDRLRHLADAAGKGLTAFVAEIVQQAAAAPLAPVAGSPEDFEQALDELFAADNRKLPATSLTYSTTRG